MKLKEFLERLLKESKELDMEVVAESQDFYCSGHGEDEYCYCDTESKVHQINTIVLVNNDEYGRSIKPRLQINLER